MKRTGFRKRVMVFPTPLVRPITDRYPNLAQTSSRNGERRRTRKIFVIKQTSRLPATNAAGKKIRRLLIFDTHPDAIQLVFGSRANRHVDLSVPQRVRCSELVLVSILIMSALI